jgi:methionyl-tRNA formyltransferase
MRLLFAGTPDIAVPSLRELAGHHTVCGVLTSPDRRAGRGRRTVPSPVKAAAEELGLPVIQPARLGSDARKQVAELSPRLLVVFAYGRIFGPKFLSLFPRGGVNIHPSLLPKYRGPSPIQAAVLAGDLETGISVQSVALEMDAGDIYAQIRIPLTGSETAESLSSHVAAAAAPLIRSVVDGIEAGTATATPQAEEGVSYCSIITKEDGEIDWRASAVAIERMVRAYNPWPTAHTTFEGRGLSILAATVDEDPGAGNPSGSAGSVGLAGAGETRTSPGAPDARVDSSETPAVPGRVLGMDKRRGILVQTADGTIAVRKLQLQSKKALDYKAFWNGVNNFKGAVLGST